jgi:translation initiation factor IF-1
MARTLQEDESTVQSTTKMPKQDHIELDGVVEEVLAGGMFRVRLESGLSVLAHLAGKMRKFRIRIVLGDSVRIAVSPYDLTKGRIIFRNK